MTPQDIFEQQDRLGSILHSNYKRLQHIMQTLTGILPPQDPGMDKADYPSGVFPKLFAVNNELAATANETADVLRYLEESLGLIEGNRKTAPVSEGRRNGTYDAPKPHTQAQRRDPAVIPGRTSPLRMAMAKVDEDEALEKKLAEALDEVNSESR